MLFTETPEATAQHSKRPDVMEFGASVGTNLPPLPEKNTDSDEEAELVFKKKEYPLKNLLLACGGETPKNPTLKWDDDNPHCKNINWELPAGIAKAERWTVKLESSWRSWNKGYGAEPNSARYFAEINSVRMQHENEFWAKMSARHHRVPVFKQKKQALSCNVEGCEWVGRTFTSAYKHFKGSHFDQLCVFRNFWCKIQKEKWHKPSVQKAEDAWWPQCNCVEP